MKGIMALALADAALAVLGWSTRTASADIIFNGYQDRLVVAEAGASDALNNPTSVDTGQNYVIRAGSNDYTEFNQSVTNTAICGRSTSTAYSYQDSWTSPTQIVAAGQIDLGGGTSTPPNGGGVSAFGNNTFELYFSVDAPGLYNLTTTLNHSWSGQVIFNVEACDVQFADVVGNSQVFLNRRLVDDPGGTSTMQVNLQPGDTYRLLVELPLDATGGHVNNGGGSFTHNVDYAVNLALAPEPATLCLLALGGLGALERAARRRVRR